MTAVTPERGEGLDPELVAGFRQMIQRAPSPATDEVVGVLRELVQINEQHNAAVEKVIGRPVGWKDSYLDRARSLLAKLEVGK